MHRNPARRFVKSSQQPRDLILTTLAEHMKTPRTVLAAAPGKKNAFHGQLGEPAGVAAFESILSFEELSSRAKLLAANRTFRAWLATTEAMKEAYLLLGRQHSQAADDREIPTDK
jgi:hypothetical protein